MTAFCDNADNVKPKNFRYVRIAVLIIAAAMLALNAYFTDDISTADVIIIIAVFFLLLPVHELCHVAALKLMKKPTDGIRFFPNGIIAWLGAYVKPGLCVMNRRQMLFFSAAPLLFLTLIPALIAPFIPAVRFSMLLLAIGNFGSACLDIPDICGYLSLPRRALYFTNSGWWLPRGELPIIIHYIQLNKDRTGVEVHVYSSDGRNMTEIENAQDDPRVTYYIKEFQTQFNLPDSAGNSGTSL